jgi:DNA-binding XRE family transcriptional regulator
MVEKSESAEVCRVFYAAFGKAVHDAREGLGMTQLSLATSVGLTRTSITNIEKGRQKLLLHTAVQLATAVGLDWTAVASTWSSAFTTSTSDPLTDLPPEAKSFVDSAIANAGASSKEQAANKRVRTNEREKQIHRRGGGRATSAVQDPKAPGGR